MSMTEWRPDPKKFLECERDTIQFLKDKPAVAKYFTHLKREAERRYASYEKINFKKLEFESEIEIDLSSKRNKYIPGIANVSAYIEMEAGGFKKISYNLAIINLDKNQKPSKILRKFHFDYDPPGADHRFPHPIIHLQYAGKLSPKLDAMNLKFDHLDTDLEKPRLYYIPLSLALLINFVLKEFAGKESTNLIKLPEWRNLIRKNENIVLEPFFANCHRFLRDRPDNRLFVNDFYYGN